MVLPFSGHTAAVQLSLPVAPSRRPKRFLSHHFCPRVEKIKEALEKCLNLPQPHPSHRRRLQRKNVCLCWLWCCLDSAFSQFSSVSLQPSKAGAGSTVWPLHSWTMQSISAAASPRALGTEWLCKQFQVKQGRNLGVSWSFCVVVFQCRINHCQVRFDLEYLQHSAV